MRDSDRDAAIVAMQIVLAVFGVAVLLMVLSLALQALIGNIA